MINKKQWIDWYKIQLGGGHILQLEMTDAEFEACIDMAYDIIRPYSTDFDYVTLTAFQRVQLDDDIISVIQIIPTDFSRYDYIDTNNLFDFQRNYRTRVNLVDYTAETIVPDYYVPFRFDAANHMLYMDEKYLQSMVTLKVIKNKPIEELRDERAIGWIRRYAFALIKQSIGRIRSKAKSANMPIELDGDTLLSEASSEISTLEEEMKSSGYGYVFALR